MLTMFAGLLAIGWAIIRIAPDSATARLLHRWIVAWPARLMMRVERRHILFVVVALVSVQALTTIGAPELGVVLAWDVSTYLDLLIIGWTLAAVTNIKAASRVTGARLSRLVRSSRRTAPRPRSARRQRHTKTQEHSSNDDHPARNALAA